MADLTRRVAQSDALSTSLESIDPALATFLGSLDLPTENLLAPMDDRRIVISQLASAIELIPGDARRKSAYLSKFVTAAAIGLFDAAVDYLWNETVQALRRQIANFDLSYFFDVAEKREAQRLKLHTAEDLTAIEDATLVDTCARIGLLTDVNRERLRHVNFMRNHASAAHANNAEINGSELVSWLTNCVKYAIVAKLDPSVLKVQRLLHNIRENELPDTDVPVILYEVPRLGAAQIEDLLWTMFGMYVDPGGSPTVRANITKLGTAVWDAAAEDRRHEIGARYAIFIKNGDLQRKQLADAFLSSVGGQGYKTEDVLVPELLDKLRSLRAAHIGMRNFYNEWPHAKALESSLPVSRMVPRPARLEWVKVITQCWIGNGLGYYGGVDTSAVSYYETYIDRFGENEIATFLYLMNDPDFTVDFGASMAESRLRTLATKFKTMTQNVFILRALDQITAAPPRTMRGLAGTTNFIAALKSVPQPP